MSKFYIIFASFLFVLSTGCATIINGKTQKISVRSNVEGADVYIYDFYKMEKHYLGKTPFSGEAPRTKKAKLIVEKKGYKTEKAFIPTKTTLTHFGNTVTTISYGLGFTATTTDLTTGSVYEYAPNAYIANLEPEDDTVKLQKFRKESPLRLYVIFNFDKINADLVDGKGKYLDALFEIYEATTDTEKEEILAYSRHAHSESDSITDFAQKMVDKL